MWLANQAHIQWHWQPALLVELAQRYQVDEHALLNGTRIFLPRQEAISPQQWLRLCENAQRLKLNDDFGFRYGQRLLPNAFGISGQTVQNATTLEQAIATLMDYAIDWMPLFAPRWYRDDRHVHIEWFEPFGLGKAYELLTQSYFSAWVTGLNWLSQKALPFQAQVNLSAGDSAPLWHSFVTTQVTFDQSINRLSLPLHCLSLSLPQGSPAGFDYGRQQLAQRPTPQSFSHWLYQHLQQSLPQLPELDEVCHRLGISRASCKRYLRLSGLSYRELCDRVRFDEAMRLQHNGRFSPQQLAEALSFYDTSNFRRAYKRWQMQFVHSTSAPSGRLF